MGLARSFDPQALVEASSGALYVVAHLDIGALRLYTSDMTKHAQKRSQRSFSPVPKEVMDCTDHSRLRARPDEIDPRKRTLLACELCRHRKTKCDAAKPACGFCSELGVDCVYRDAVTPKLDYGSKTILSRLDRIEELMREQHRMTAKQELTPRGPSDRPAQSTKQLQDVPIDSGFLQEFSRYTDVSAEQTRKSQTLESSPLPICHPASTSYLITWPQIKDLITVQHEPNHLLRLEMLKSRKREDLLPGYSVENTPNLDRNVTNNLIQCYWKHQQLATPILDYASFESLYWSVQIKGMRNEMESCCVLLVCALGAASFPNHHRNPGAPYRAGQEYYKMAISIMSGLCSFITMPDLITAQSMCLAATYLGFIGKPLEQLRFNSIAAGFVIQLLQKSKLDPQSKDSEDLLKRLFWCCYNTESLILSEIEAPRTNLETMVDIVGLPLIRGPTDLDIVCFSAGVAMRRLFNRVYNTLYMTDRLHGSVHSLVPLASELGYQLTSWFKSIPQDVRPELNQSLEPDDRQLYLKIRYYLCKHFIHRPFLLHVLTSDPKTSHSQTILDHAKQCVEACRSFLLAGRCAIDRPRNNLWIATQAVFSTAIVLIAASRHSLTSRYVPSDIGSVVNIALEFLQVWSGCSPTIEYICQRLKECAENLEFSPVSAGNIVVPRTASLQTDPVFFQMNRSPQEMGRAQAPAQVGPQPQAQPQSQAHLQLSSFLNPDTPNIVPSNYLGMPWTS